MTPYFKAYLFYFHIKQTKLGSKKYLASKVIFNEENWGKLLKFGPECVKQVILFPLQSKTESCETTKVCISKFDIEYGFFCKISESWLYQFTSGGLICKRWSHLPSELFFTAFLRGHCPWLAIKWLFRCIE